MAGFFRKLLGVIVLLSTVSLSTCQTMVNTYSEDTSKGVEDKKVSHE